MLERLRRPETVENRLASARMILGTDSYRNALLNATNDLLHPDMERVAFAVVDTGRRLRSRFVPTALQYQIGISDWEDRPLKGVPKNADILPHIVHTVLVKNGGELEEQLPAVPPIDFFDTLKNRGFFFGYYGIVDPALHIEGMLYSKPYILPEDPAQAHKELLELETQDEVDMIIKDTFGSDTAPTSFVWENRGDEANRYYLEEK